MSTYRNAFQRLHRSYFSLNLKIHVNQDKDAVQVVLPGLRFDDLTHTGQPNVVTLFDLMSHVETAAFGAEPSFLEYLLLRKHKLRTYTKALQMDISSEFYETTTPKAPLDVHVHLSDIGCSTFTTTNELFCGGSQKPSIRLRSLHTLVDKKMKTVQKVPDWWKQQFSSKIKNDSSSSSSSKLLVEPVHKSAPSLVSSFTVPLSDTDHNETTRCASYVQYFTDGASVASRKEMLKHIKSSFHEFHIKRLSAVYFGGSKWGDHLTSEVWQDEKANQILCEVSLDGTPLWFGEMELYHEVFGFPSLQTYPQEESSDEETSDQVPSKDSKETHT